MSNRQFRPERLDVHARRGQIFPYLRPSTRRSILALALMVLLTACEAPRPRKRTLYEEPATVSGQLIFARGQLPAATEAEHLRQTQTSPGLLRRAWLELQLGQAEAALCHASRAPGAKVCAPCNRSLHASSLHALLFTP